MKKFLEKNSKIIIVCLFCLNLLTLFKGCSNSKIIRNYEVQIKNNDIKIDSLIRTMPTKKDVENSMEKVMLDYLIYEDELDNNKITLSNIKEKIND